MGLFAFDDAAAAELAGRHGTPVFAYRADVVTAAYERLRAALPTRARIAYAVKANPHEALVGHLVGLGASLDCASIGELELAGRVGANRAYFTGPAKQRHELAVAARAGVRVQAESWEDVATLDDLVDGPTAVNVRVHLREGVSEANRIIGGTGPSAFGVDEEDLPAFLERCRGLRHVQVRGLHVFAASNERSAATLLATYGLVFNVARRMRDELGVPIEQIDVGGGLGMPYAPGDPELDVEALGAGVGELLARESWFDGELMLEPGRYLAAGCGVYLSRVVRVKHSRGTRFVILQGGVNHLLRPLLTGEPFPVRMVGSGEGAPVWPATLAGPLCTSLDRLGEVELPDVAPGDLLLFGQAGAYGYTEAMTNFLLHPVPPEVWVAH